MSNKLPPGYFRWVSPDNQVFLIPIKPFEALQEERTRYARKDAPAEEERILKLRGKAKESKKPADWRETFGEVSPPGHLRVLGDYDALVSGAMEQDLACRTADKDVRERMQVLLEKLKNRGPDRLIGGPMDASSALDELQRVLPHFRGPLGLVRNCLALAEASTLPVRIPPMLLLGPPGVGKTLFSHKLAEALGVPNASIAFDQPSAGSQLCGSDKYWSNSATGLLFQLICEGRYANPVILLDELDKASVGSGARALDPLAQLHGALEVQTARRSTDLSTDIVFDASLTTYIATANSVRGLGMPLLSRFEVFLIEPPGRDDSVGIARRIATEASERLRLTEPVVFERRCFYVLARMSPRLMHRTVDKALGEAVADKRRVVTEQDLWQLLGMGDEGPRPH
ncbi:AAA family ATPase [Methylibium sp.]|uniref:AAA family ATPase n=1 Tax=Methylibium sp. TaxID=2067992 RepID=UPI0017DD9AB1|nr:AAA family ATPase [Methylibium sp.]MBA3591063.1 AAA family ATPase [Methylibium sp.]